MILSLRQKRRQETALEIQRATLELAMEHGLEGVTTDEIAAASGISTRTFFNYYANKEAAAVGHPPTFTEEQKDTLRNGTGPLTTDLKRLLDSQMEALSQREDILHMIGEILQSNEKARGILDGILSEERRTLTRSLSSRVDNAQAAASLANNVTSAIGAAIFLWKHEEDMTLSAALDAVWEGLIEASRLLSSADNDKVET